MKQTEILLDIIQSNSYIKRTSEEFTGCRFDFEFEAVYITNSVIKGL